MFQAYSAGLPVVKTDTPTEDKEICINLIAIARKYTVKRLS